MRDLLLSDRLASARNTYRVFDDFDWYISPHFWTNLSADAGVTAPAQSDAEHGVVQGATGATDNNEIMVRSTNEVALFQANYSCVFESRIQYTEANTDDANVCVGLADAAAANLLVDDGAGARTSGNHCLIYKIDGGTVWRCTARNGTGVTDTVSVQTAGGAAYQNLRIVVRETDGTNLEVTYFLDNLPLTDSNNRPIKHTILIASSTELRLVAGYIKAGGANSETLNLDYCAFEASRV